MVNENNAKRIDFLYLSVNNMAAKKMIFKLINAIPISGKTPPYSLKILLPERM